MLSRVNRANIYMFQLAFVGLYILLVAQVLHDTLTGDSPSLNNYYTTPLRNIHSYSLVTAALISTVSAFLVAASRVYIRFVKKIRRAQLNWGEVAAITFLLTLPWNILAIPIGLLVVIDILTPSPATPFITTLNDLINVGLMTAPVHIIFGLIVYNFYKNRPFKTLFTKFQPTKSTK